MNRRHSKFNFDHISKVTEPKKKKISILALSLEMAGRNMIV